jgi:hypothetical protein
MASSFVAGSFVLYRGPSRIDGQPIVAIVTGLAKRSGNVKTGAMAQTWILRDDIAPLDALRTGSDVSVCGGCPHRPTAHTGTGYSGRSCYVNVSKAPTSVYRAYRAGRYCDVSGDLATIATLAAGRLVRLGSYGDPAAVPLPTWNALVASALGHTGYTHQWKSAKLRDVTALCQASVDSLKDLHKAKSLGLATFRVALPTTGPGAGETVCPASAEAGKVATCATCMACDGTGRNIVIQAHGIGARYVKT